MPELRRNKATGRLVVIATERGDRIDGFCQDGPSFSLNMADCPFCPGNEDKTPSEAYAAYPKVDSPKDDWLVRVIANKFPAFTLQALSSKETQASNHLFEKLPALGNHEVIINTRDHKGSLARLQPDEIDMLLKVYLARLSALNRFAWLKSWLIILNHGRMAGASIEHPHSQLFAMAIENPLLNEELAAAKSYFESEKSCVYCDMIEEERAAKERALIESDHFFSFFPFASRFPFEIWILPKRHSRDFEAIGQDERTDLATLLKRVAEKLANSLNDPAYNLYIHSDRLLGGEDDCYHWHIEIIPRISIVAGFEMGSNMTINIVGPERAAAILTSS